LFPQVYRAELYGWFDGLVEAAVPQKREISALRKHVTPFMCEAGVGLAPGRDKPLFVMTVRDINDIKKAQRRSAKQIERDSILRETSAILLDSRLDDALRACLSQIADHYWFSAAHCWRATDSCLESCGIWLGDGMEDLRAAILREKLARGRDLAGQACRLHHTLFVDDSAALDYIGHRDLLVSSGMCALYAVPLIHNGEVLGVMQFYNPMPARLEGEDETFLCQMGAQMGRAFHREKIRRDIRAPLQAIEDLIAHGRGAAGEEHSRMLQALEISALSLRKIIDAGDDRVLV
jgi:GAF domain-containing protein